MITLTLPVPISTVLGADTKINYDTLVICPITYDLINLTISATIKLTSSGNIAMKPIYGSVTANLINFKLDLDVPRMDFSRSINLSAPQISAIKTLLTNSQNAIESGLIDLGVIAGVQTPEI